MESDSLNKIYDLIKIADECLNESDRKKLLELMISLFKFQQNSKKIKFKYYPCDKKTNSLYRFGWFEFGDNIYFIYNWNFRKKIVTFLNEDETIKLVYSINDNDFIKNKEILFPSFFKRIKKSIRNKIKKFLKELSEKL